MTGEPDLRVTALHAVSAHPPIAGGAEKRTGRGSGGRLGPGGAEDLAAGAGVPAYSGGTRDKSAPPAVPVSPGPTVPVVAADDMAAAVTACAFASVLVEAPVLVDGFVDEGVAGGALPSAARLGGGGRGAPGPACPPSGPLRRRA